MEFTQSNFDYLLVSIIQMGIDRCTAGFGKYPLGILEAAERLATLTESPEVTVALAKFHARLERP